MKKEDVIATLIAKNVKFSEDASYNDLCKILKEQPVPRETTPQTGGAGQTQPTPAEKALMEANEKLVEANKKLAKATEPKGIKTRRKPGEKLKRPDDVMNDDLKTIGTTPPSGLSEDQRIALERQIRKHVKSGTKMIKGVAANVTGGWRKGVSEADKERTIKFLERIGRPLEDGKEPAWDTSIVVPGMQW